MNTLSILSLKNSSRLDLFIGSRAQAVHSYSILLIPKGFYIIVPNPYHYPAILVIQFSGRCSSPTVNKIPIVMLTYEYARHEGSQVVHLQARGQLGSLDNTDRVMKNIQSYIEARDMIVPGTTRLSTPLCEISRNSHLILYNLPRISLF